jgi:hypothetical protein
MAFAAVVTALVTAAYVALTRTLSRRATESAEASRRAAEAAERAVELELLPLLFPALAELGEFEGHTDKVVLINAGRGVAVNPELWLETEGPGGPRTGHRAWARIVKGGETSLPEQMMTPEEHAGRHWVSGMVKGPMAYVLEYEDVRGNRFLTRVPWVPPKAITGPGSLGPISIVRLDPDGTQRPI